MVMKDVSESYLISFLQEINKKIFQLIAADVNISNEIRKESAF